MNNYPNNHHFPSDTSSQNCEIDASDIVSTAAAGTGTGTRNNNNTNTTRNPTHNILQQQQNATTTTAQEPSSTAITQSSRQQKHHKLPAATAATSSSSLGNQNHNKRNRMMTTTTMKGQGNDDDVAAVPGEERNQKHTSSKSPPHKRRRLQEGDASALEITTTNNVTDGTTMASASHLKSPTNVAPHLRHQSHSAAAAAVPPHLRRQQQQSSSSEQQLLQQQQQHHDHHDANDSSHHPSASSSSSVIFYTASFPFDPMQISQDYSIEPNFCKKNLPYEPFSPQLKRIYEFVNVPFVFLTNQKLRAPPMPYTRKFDSVDHYVIFWTNCVMHELRANFMALWQRYFEKIAIMNRPEFATQSDLQARVPIYWKTNYYASRVNTASITLRDSAGVSAEGRWYNCPLYRLRLDADSSVVGGMAAQYQASGGADITSKSFFAMARRFSILLLGGEYMAIFLEKVSQYEFVVASLSKKIKQHRNEIKILDPTKLSGYFYRFHALNNVPRLSPEQKNALLNFDEPLFQRYVKKQGSFPFKAKHVQHKYFGEYHHLPKKMSAFLETNFCHDEQRTLINLYKGRGIRLVQCVAGSRVQRLLLGIMSILQRRVKKRILIVADEAQIADCLLRIKSAGIFDGHTADIKKYCIGSYGRLENQDANAQKFTFDNLVRNTVAQRKSEINKKHYVALNNLKEALDKAKARTDRRANSIDYLSAQYSAAQGKLKKELAAVDVHSIRKELLNSPHLIAFVPTRYIHLIPSEINHVDFVIVTENTHELESLSLLTRFVTCELAVFMVDLLYAPSDSIYDTTLVERLEANGFPLFTVQMQYLYHPRLSRLLNFFYPGVENYGRIEFEGSDVYKAEFKPFSMYKVNNGDMVAVSSTDCYNEREARYIKNILNVVRRRLIDDPKKRLWVDRVVLVTPYPSQKALLQQEVKDLGPIKVGTPDELKGYSADIVIFSAVLTENGATDHFKDRSLRLSRVVGKAIPIARFSFIVVGDIDWLCENSGKIWSYMNRINNEGAEDD